MRVKVLNKTEADLKVAQIIKDCVMQRKKPVLGLVTGSTPRAYTRFYAICSVGGRYLLKIR